MLFIYKSKILAHLLTPLILHFWLAQHSFVLFSQFGGTEGEWFQKLTARFCSHQSWALDQIKSRQKKEPRFNSFILVPENSYTHTHIQIDRDSKISS